MAKETITLDVSQLQEIIGATAAAIAAELRKPEPMSAQAKAEIEQRQADRAATAAGIKEKKERDLWFQTNGCQHKHSGQFGGTHCVYVRDNDVPTSPGMVLCQACQGRFRPDEPVMRRLDPTAIFDTAKYNTLMQDCAVNGAEIVG